jgi:hypothetical protein
VWLTLKGLLDASGRSSAAGPPLNIGIEAGLGSRSSYVPVGVAGQEGHALPPLFGAADCSLILWKNP